jgi:hypothetical protein
MVVVITEVIAFGKDGVDFYVVHGEFVGLGMNYIAEHSKMLGK